MIDYIRNNKSSIILIIILISILCFYLIRGYISNKKFDNNKIIEYEMIPKTYGVNEYTNVNITDEDMAEIYLNNFINEVYSDVGKSYNLLDEEYRETRFNSIEEYKDYINNLNFGKIDKFSKIGEEDYIIYKIYDTNNNFFEFIVEGVMQYKVYLDEETEENSH